MPVAHQLGLRSRGMTVSNPLKSRASGVLSFRTRSLTDSSSSSQHGTASSKPRAQPGSPKKTRETEFNLFKVWWGGWGVYGGFRRCCSSREGVVWCRYNACRHRANMFSVFWTWNADGMFNNNCASSEGRFETMATRVGVPVGERAR